jgi:hypothetical protein
MVRTLRSVRQTAPDDQARIACLGRARGPARCDLYNAEVQLRIFTEPQQGASYDDLLAVARTAEECGFDAFSDPTITW